MFVNKAYRYFIKLYKEILFSDPTIELESNSIKRTEDATLVIGEVTDTLVSDLIFFDIDDHGQIRVIVSGVTEINNSTEENINE